MRKRGILAATFIAHVLCLLPLAWLTYQNTSTRLLQSADPTYFITNSTGDWALYMLLASLAITPIRRLSLRVAWVAGLRRLVGLYAFFYATLHLAAYLFLFSGYDVPSSLAAIGSGHLGAILVEWKAIWPVVLEDLLKRRYIQAGYVSWFLLLALACTSPMFMTRAMGGKHWRRLHRLVYIAAIAGLLHFFWLVRKGNLAPWKDTVLLAVLLVMRITYTAMKRTRKFMTR